MSCVCRGASSAYCSLVRLLVVEIEDVMSVIVRYGGFFFQAEDGIRDLVRSRGLGDVYKRQLIGLRLTRYERVRVVECLPVVAHVSGVRIPPVWILSLIHI